MKETKDELISYETAVLAKEKGFDLECDKGYYVTVGNKVDDKLVIDTYKNEPDFYYSPTQSILQRWLREKRNIHVEISLYIEYDWQWDLYKIYYTPLNESFKIKSNSYEQALETGLFEALKLIK